MDLTLTSVMPLLISSVTAASISYLIFGTEATFAYQASEAFALGRMPWVIVLGALCGLASLYFTKISFGLERKLKGMPHYWQRFLVCALILSTLIFLLPPLYGEGYSSISTLIGAEPQRVMQGSFFEQLTGTTWVLPLFLLLAVLAKVFATVATNAGGGAGGVFAPSLFIGALVGFAFSYFLNILGLNVYLPTDR